MNVEGRITAKIRKILEVFSLDIIQVIKPTITIAII